MKIFYSAVTAILLLLCAGVVSAQTSTSDNLIRCYTVEHQEELRAKYNLPSINEFEEWLSPKVEEFKKNYDASKNNVLTIPVVVHVMHNGEAINTIGNANDVPNISDAQVISQIKVLNEDFRRLNADRVDTRAEFEDDAADVELSFVMAQTGPDGGPTDGINRVNVGQDGLTRDDLENTWKPETQWDPTKYLNMWSVKFAAPDDNLLGYAQFPDDSGLAGVSNSSPANTDGVVMRYAAFGTINEDDGSFTLNNTYNLGRTATHEVGHWVGLRHIWGDMLGCSSLPLSNPIINPPTGCSCTVDDFCDDTPNADLANYGCALDKVSVCNAPTVTTDQIENYMDYTNDACMNMFTNDQKFRVLTVMANSPRRRELPTSEALFPPGTYVTFTNRGSEITEGTACGGVTTIDIPVKISKVPNTNVDVTFTLSGTGNDANNQLTTATATFPADDDTEQIITVAIGQDFISEGNETLTVTIDQVNANGGDALIGFTNITHDIFILDDDFEPARAGLSAVEPFYTEDFDGSDPDASWTEGLQDGAVNWYEGINIDANFSIGSGNVAFVSADGLQAVYNQFLASTTRFVSRPIDTRGIQNINLSLDFIVHGEGSSTVNYDFGRVEYSIDGTNFKTLTDENIGNELVGTLLFSESGQFTAPLPREAENIETLYIAVYWENDGIQGAVNSLAVDNIVLTGAARGQAEIATTLTSNAIQAEVNANETIHFYDANNKIIASLHNGNQDLGCTDLSILADGAANNSPMSTIGANTEAASKVITINPSLNAATADYTLDFYFTKNEIDTWISNLTNSGITVDIDDFKIFKTNNSDLAQASDTDTDADANTSFDSYNVSGVDGYIFSADFVGFSSFGGANITFPFDVTAEFEDVSCNGVEDGSITLTVINSGLDVSALATYEWEEGTSGLAQNSISNLPAGDYPVSVTFNGQTIPFSYTVDEPLPVLLSFTTQNATCGEDNGFVTAIVQNAANDEYTINWNTPNNDVGDQNNRQVTGLGTGTYSAQIQDSNGCLSETVEFTVESIGSPFSLTLDVLTDVTCNGGNNGVITFSDDASNPPVNYRWSHEPPNDPEGLNSLSNLSAGTYFVTATDQDGCQEVSGPHIISEPENPVSVTVTTTEANCGQSDGTATATVMNATTANYIIDWSEGLDGNEGSTTVEDLAAGSYTVKIIDGNSCESMTVPFVIENADNGTIVNDAITNNTCHDDANGEIVITLDGTNTENAIYAWSSDVDESYTANTPTISNLIAGTYTLTLTNAVGCQQVIPYDVTQPENPIEISVTTTAANCGQSDGTATATVMNTTTPEYTIDWSMGPDGNEGNTTVENLPAGFYTVVVTDNNNCTSTSVPFTIGNQADRTTVSEAITNVTCNGGNDGEIVVTLAGDDFDQATFTWSSNATTVNTTSGVSTISNLTADTYTLEVTNNVGCVQNFEYEVTQPAEPITIELTTTDANCGQSDGSAMATAVNATNSDYTIEWNNGAATGAQNNRTLNGLAPGTNYNVKIIDANGCESAVLPFTIANQANQTVATPTITHVTCKDGNNGQIAIALSGDDFDEATFLWSNNATTPTISNLEDGTYMLTLTNNVGCQQMLSYTVNEPANPVSVSVSTTEANCGQSDGSATATVMNATTSNYTIDWSMGTDGDQDNTTVSGLAAGNYTVMVTDENSCTSTSVPFTIANQADQTVATPTITHVTCKDGNNGQIAIALSGDDFDEATFLWSNNATTPTISNLEDGTYMLTLTNNVGCQQMLSYTVNEPANPVSISVSTTEANCGQNDGSATATVMNATTSNYTIDWSMGTDGDQDNTTVSGLAAGNYTVIVTDENSCTSTSVPFTIANQADQTVATPTITHITCKDGDNGQIAIALSGDDFDEATFLWSNNATTPTISNLEDGTYMLTLTNNVGCQQMLSYTVNEPANPVSISVSTTEANCGQNDGSATATVMNATTSNYTIDWSMGTDGDQDNTTVSGLAAGNYTVIVTDENSCASTSVPFTIGDKPNGTEAVETITHVSCNEGSNGQILIELNGTDTENSTYAWSNNASSSALLNLSAGTYTLTLTNGVGCKQILPYEVTEPSAISLTQNTVTDESNCDANDASITVTPTGGTPNSGVYNFAWSTGASDNSTGTSATLDGLDSGTFTVSVTDGNNCLATETFETSCQADALSVQLIAFTATLDEQKNAQLIWTVGTETNFSHYEILRSHNGTEWTSIGQINANQQSNYQGTDKQLLTKFRAGNIVYYQLKMVDLDGNFSVSPVRQVQLPTVSSTLTAFPNPTVGELTVQFSTTQTTTAELSVFGLSGQLIKTYEIDAPNEMSQYKLDMTNFATGVYIIQLQLEDGIHHVKSVVE